MAIGNPVDEYGVITLRKLSTLRDKPRKPGARLTRILSYLNENDVTVENTEKYETYIKTLKEYEDKLRQIRQEADAKLRNHKQETLLKEYRRGK